MAASDAAPSRRTRPVTVAEDRGSPAGLRALEAPPLAGRAYDLLRERILGGIFKPGERLSVAELAKQLGVSQMPVREALGHLAREGLVEIRPRSGTYVAPLNLRDLVEVFDLRMGLEQMAADSLLANVRTADERELARLVKRIQASKALDEHYRMNARFHQRLVELSGNRRLADLYNQLHAHVHVALVHVLAPGWWRDTPVEAEEHATILRAIKLRDRAALKAAVLSHLARSRATLLAQLAERDKA